MAVRQSLLNEFDEEMKGTRKVLERVLDEKTDWRPHEKSMTLGRLATHVAELPEWTVNALTKDVLEFNLPHTPTILKNTKEMVALFDKHAKAARDAIEGAKDTDWPKTWTLKVNGKVAFEGLKESVYRSFAMNHLVHHRAQLGVYLRLLGVALPGLYGPTADDRPM